MRVLITGITGTLGTVVAKKLLLANHSVVGLSRDEQKQKTFQYKNDVEMLVGDVKDRDSIERASIGCSVIFHFAANKCIDVCELNPEETYKTNLLGARNICIIAKKRKARVVFTSTDKAVYPVNVYGMSKGIAEKIVLDYDKDHIVCRYGNVLGSRGSVLPLFINSILKNNEVNITDADMSRFWISQDNAAEFVINAGMNLKGLQIPNIKSSYIVQLADVLSRCLNREPKFNFIGMNPVEKIHECLSLKKETGKDVYSNDKEYLMNNDELSEYIKPILDEI